MVSPESSRRSLLRMLKESLLPAVSGKEMPALSLMEPANLLRNNPRVALQSGLPLDDAKRMRSPLYLHRWYEYGMHSVRFPCLIAVVKGEIDWRIGVTQSAVQESDGRLKESSHLVVPIPENTFCLMPPEVPYSDGRGMHWERPYPREEPAIIFWMLILPVGFMCHFCHSTASEHRSHRQFFVPCPEVHQLAKMLEEELAREGASNSMIVRAHIQAILGYVERGLQSQVTAPILKSESTLQLITQEHGTLPQDAVQRAKTFIETHLQDTLTAEEIAKHAYLSARQLDRYFRRDFGVSLTTYVLQKRIEMAKSLLRDTDLPIRRVGHIVGYPNFSSFTQVFKRQTGNPPSFYRSTKESPDK